MTEIGCRIVPTTCTYGGAYIRPAKRYPTSARIRRKCCKAPAPYKLWNKPGYLKLTNALRALSCSRPNRVWVIIWRAPLIRLGLSPKHHICMTRSMASIYQMQCKFADFSNLYSFAPDVQCCWSSVTNSKSSTRGTLTRRIQYWLRKASL